MCDYAYWFSGNQITVTSAWGIIDILPNFWWAGGSGCPRKYLSGNARPLMAAPAVPLFADGKAD